MSVLWTSLNDNLVFWKCSEKWSSQCCFLQVKKVQGNEVVSMCYIIFLISRSVCIVYHCVNKHLMYL